MTNLNSLASALDKLYKKPIKLLSIVALLALSLSCSDNSEEEKPVAELPIPKVDAFQAAHESLSESEKDHISQTESIKKEIEDLENQITRNKQRLVSQEKKRSHQWNQFNYLSNSNAFFPVGYHFMSPTFYYLQRAAFLFFLLSSLIWLHRRHSEFFGRHKSKLVPSAVLIALLYLSPAAFAQEAEIPDSAEPGITSEQPQEPTRAETLSATLSKTLTAVKNTSVQRYIVFMERLYAGNFRRSKQNVPAFEAGHPLLKPLDTFTGLGIEYHYTLAALYEKDGRRINAIATITKLLQIERASYSEPDAALVVNSVGYLLDIGSLDVASETIAKVITRIRSTEENLELGQRLYEKQLTDEAQLAFEAALKNAKQADDYLLIARKVHELGLAQTTRTALESALSRRLSQANVLEVLRLSKARNLAETTDLATQRAVTLFDPRDDGFASDFEKIYQFLIENSEQSASVVLFNETVKKALGYDGKTALRSIEEMAATAVRYNNAPLATTAIESLSKKFGEGSLSANTSLLNVLDREKDLQNPTEQVSIQTLYGTLNEATRQTEAAKTAFYKASLARMNQIIENYGQGGEIMLNDFFLARDALKNIGDEESANKLEELYALLMEKKVSTLKAQQEQSLAELERAREQRVSSLASNKEKLALSQEQSLGLQLMLLRAKNFVELVVMLAALVAVFKLSNDYRKRFHRSS